MKFMTVLKLLMTSDVLFGISQNLLINLRGTKKKKKKQIRSTEKMKFDKWKMNTPKLVSLVGFGMHN